jgi:hypothetical protein
MEIYTVCGHDVHNVFKQIHPKEEHIAMAHVLIATMAVLYINL